MPINDRREPGVYVTIEDTSYIAPTIEVGRTVFMCGLCPKGPHNQVVTVTSHAEFQQIFGKPDFNKTSQTHYFMDKAMQYTGKGLYIRVVPLDAKVANVSVLEEVSDEEVMGTFGFVQAPKDDEIVSRPFPEDYELGELDAGYIAAKDAFAAYVRKLDDSRYVTVSELETFEKLSIGDWIYAGPQIDPSISPDDETVARQIISMEWDELTNTGKLMLNDGYKGLPYTSGGQDIDWVTKTTDSVFVYSQYKIESDDLRFTWDVTNENLDMPQETVITFYATGAGKEYNGLRVKGVRNTQLEKMYMDDDANILYKYLFMNIGIYKEEDGKSTLMEGPWPVSLVNRTPDDIIIRDLSSGQLLFIEDVINKNSSLVKCKAGQSLSNLVNPPAIDEIDREQKAERNRLSLMLALSASSPVGTEFVPTTQTGAVFANGFDGHADFNENDIASPTIPLYKYGKLQVAPEIYGLIAQAYNGTLTSVDGSIEQLGEVTYPWYDIDYIVTGGFPPYVQNAGRQMAEYREDCHHFGDTGYRTGYQSDLSARLDATPWNNWTSSLYVQYRKIKDPYTGEDMMISPCYHAIERHLYVDGVYFLAEPVAGIEKGAIAEPMELAYRANHTERGDLTDVELNPTIVEPDGKYFLTQFTTWKRLSILKRQHAAKFVAYVRKSIPPLLKGILQRRATPYWINMAQSRVDYFLSQFKDSSVERYYILDNYSVGVEFDKTASELNVHIGLDIIEVIERINVFINVQ